MNVKIKLLRQVLANIIDDIDAGNSNITEEECNDVIESLSILNKGIKRISKREACDRILKCSSATFDNYLKLGLIPKGQKTLGFKELSWCEKDFDKAIKYRNTRIGNNTPEERE